MKHLFTIIFALALAACNLPRPQPPTPSKTPTVSYSDCGFVEARQNLPELSAEFLRKLKQAGLPVDSARAEAYGENCLTADNSVAYFAARETDFYVTLNVSNLTDEATLGAYLGKILDIIDKVPPTQTGPNPGYIGVTFRAGDQAQNLWFTQTQANDLRAQGLKGADLYRALYNKP